MTDPVKSLAGVKYWDSEFEDYIFCDHAYDSDGELLGRQGHAYPDTVVLSLEAERDRLLEQRYDLRRDLARAQHYLAQANKKIDRLEL